MTNASVNYSSARVHPRGIRGVFACVVSPGGQASLENGPSALSQASGRADRVAIGKAWIYKSQKLNFRKYGM